MLSCCPVSWEGFGVAQVVFFQQGLTKWDVEGRLRGQLDVPLCPAGVSAVTAAARELAALGPEVVYHGPEQPGRETAGLVAQQSGAAVRELAELAEVGLGLWQGLLKEEVKQRQPRVYRQWREEPARVAPPGGETLGQASERVRRALAKVGRRHRRGIVVLVVAPMLGVVARSLLGAGRLGELWERSRVPAHWELYEVSAGD